MKRIKGYILDLCTLIGGLTGVWEYAVKPINNKNIDLKQYYLEHWTTILGITILIVVVLIALRRLRKLQYAEDKIRIEDAKEMDLEILHAVSWWIWTLNKTKEERIIYIKKYFPRNEEKIQQYINSEPFG